MLSHERRLYHHLTKVRAAYFGRWVFSPYSFKDSRWGWNFLSSLPADCPISQLFKPWLWLAPRSGMRALRGFQHIKLFCRRPHGRRKLDCNSVYDYRFPTVHYLTSLPSTYFTISLADDFLTATFLALVALSIILLNDPSMYLIL